MMVIFYMTLCTCAVNVTMKVELMIHPVFTMVIIVQDWYFIELIAKYWILEFVLHLL